MRILINNRRYLGNKYRLLSFIKKVVDDECRDVDTILDIFSGTGAVASAFLDRTVITNDILYSNYLAHVTWFSDAEYSFEKIQSMITNYNSIKAEDIKHENYMSANFSETYFSHEICLKIGFIRDDIEGNFKNGKINEKEKAILVTSLLYAMDRIANTCGHYDAYRQNSVFNDRLELGVPDTDRQLSSQNKCFNMDANLLAKEIKADLAYLDPPYNSRQYSDTYHLPENVARWEKPEVNGVARKMDRQGLKSDYCTSRAPEVFEDLIDSLNVRYILLSYNNTRESADDRSNARISDEDIMRILSKKGRVKIFEERYRAFTTGKSNNQDNAERLFLCICNAEETTLITQQQKNRKSQENDYLKSPLNYTGGKFKLLPQIQPLLPAKTDIFVDLFCGGCNVGINTDSDKVIFNDSNKTLVGLFETFASVPLDVTMRTIDTLIKKYDLSDSARYGYQKYGCNSMDGLARYNKEKFNALKSDFNAMEIKDDAWYLTLYVLIVFAFNNQIRFNRHGRFNLPVGKRDFNLSLRNKLQRFILTLQDKHVEFHSVDFCKLDISALTCDSIVYCDPPYLITTACYNEQNQWTIEDEMRLLAYLDDLHKKGLRFALSNVLEHNGASNNVLKEWLNANDINYRVHYLDFSYGNSNYQIKDKERASTEILVTNY